MRPDEPPSTSVQAIAERLRITREALGWSQVEMARRTGMTPAAWNNYEMAFRRISVDAAIAVRAVTGMTLDWIYLGDQTGLPGRILDQLRARKDSAPGNI